MGYYINHTPDGLPLSPWDKADQLIAAGAQEIPQPTKWQPNLVCVVENSAFDAAAYAFDEREMEEFFPNAHDRRERRWLIVPDAAKLAGYKEA